MTNRVGQQLGNYRLVRHLGCGSFADVYLGEHVHLEMQAAIKVLHLPVGKYEEQFRKEAQAIARLDHPHIVRILDFGIEQNTPFLVMTYALRGTLRTHHLKGAQLSLTTILPYIQQAALALDYIHSKKLIHRDVKPENMLLQTDGAVLLSDFGIASAVHTTATLTDPGCAGTPPYMAPEQIQHRPCPASDQYALAVIVYEWLTGRRPFQGTGWALFEQHISTPPPALRNFLPTIPSALEATVLKALAKNPQQRFPTIQAFAQALEHVNQVDQVVEIAPVSPPVTNIQGVIICRACSKHNRPQAKFCAHCGHIFITDIIEKEGKHKVAQEAPQIEADPNTMLLKDAYRLYTQRQLPDALAMYDLILQTDNKNALAWQGRGLILAMQGKHQEALEAFEQALKFDPNLVTSLTGKGTALNMLHLNKEALEAFDRAIVLEKNNAIAWNGKGAAQRALGQSELALVSFDVALQYNAQMAQAWGNKGLVLRHLRRYPQSLHAFEEALLLEPPSAVYWNGKGQALSEMGHLPEARRAYQITLQLAPNYAPAYCGLGDILYREQKLKESLEYYERALSYDNRFGKAWEKRALVQADLGQFDKALESYNESLRLDPHNIVAWNGKASTLCNLKQYQEALDAYSRVLLIDSNAAQAWNGKGNAFYHLGNYELALDAYERALRLNPKMASAQHNKSLVLKHLERYDEALNAAESAIRLAPKDPDNWQRKAEALKKLRRKREARAAEVEVARLRRKI